MEQIKNCIIDYLKANPYDKDTPLRTVIPLLKMYH